MSGDYAKAKKIELWKQKVGHTHGMITQWEGSKFVNFSLVRYWKDKKTDEWRNSSEINVENFADVVELVRLAGEYLKNPANFTKPGEHLKTQAPGPDWDETLF